MEEGNKEEKWEEMMIICLSSNFMSHLKWYNFDITLHGQATKCQFILTCISMPKDVKCQHNKIVIELAQHGRILNFDNLLEESFNYVV